MKKIFTTIFVLSAALVMQAGLHLSYDHVLGEDFEVVTITQDTTIVVTDYEYDEDLEEANMEVKGQLYSDDSQDITVTITRQNTGIIDQFCAAGECIPGNGKLTQVCEFTVGTAAFQRSWFTHYTPQQTGEEVIVYTFDDGVNATIALTVKYNYISSDVESVVVPSAGDNVIYSILGQKMQGSDLSELPAGIYIINGKKYIKK